jgi:capsid portal protein
VLEAEPAAKGIGGAAGLPSQDKVKIELKPLTDAIFKDALWQGYAEGNRKELGQSFRLPPMLRGDTERLNRATAEVAQQATEQQVFQPERKDIEFEINRTILSDMGVMLWRFRLNGPDTTNTEQVAQFIKDLSEGVMTVNEARREASQLFSIDLPPIDADWARMPVKQALAGFAPEPLPEEQEEEEKDAEESERAEKILRLRLPHDEMKKLIDDELPCVDETQSDTEQSG